MNPSTVKKTLIRKSSRILGKYPVLFAYLYGSSAEGSAHPFSDVDIGIYFERVEEDERLKLELNISLELDEELPGNIRSDVRAINKMPLAITGQIVTDGILVYCRDDAARIDFESSVRMAYFDFFPVLNLHRNAFLNRHLSG